MARKRFTKPGFFSNEELAELAPEVRLFFIGSWCWADREGRLEDRPKRLKANIMPYDNIDINIALDQLQEKGFILRYITQVKGEIFKAIQILKFTNHQDVHVNEQASIIPAPVLNCASTVQAPDKHGACTSLNLELDTLNLEPLTVIDDDVKRERENEIDSAITDFLEATGEEKEKNSAKKEKELPPIDFVIEQISKLAYWRIALEHNLPPGIKWNKLIPAQKKIYEDQREDYFRIFWEQKTDRYRIRMDSWTGMAEHFYNWIPIHKTKDQRNNLLNNATKNRSAANDNAQVNTGGTRDQRNSGIADVIDQSTSFLQEYSDI